MANIFIDIPIFLEYRFQVAKGVFLGYHLTMESNTPLLLCGSTKNCHSANNFSLILNRFSILANIDL
jgi:hypothetical protein